MLSKKIKAFLNASPALVRVVPFLVFLLLTLLQGSFGETSAYWLYFAKTIIGAVMLWAIWNFISELKWAISWEALGIGVGVFVMWIALEGLYPKLSELKGLMSEGENAESANAESASWNPNRIFGEGMAWFFIVIRMLGSSLVVPPLEEIVFRSTLYRYIVDPDFQKVSFRKFHWEALIFTSLIFALEHDRWLSGFLCGLAYQWLVIKKGRVGDAITAHAITNFLLALWVIGKGEWQFW